ncbi:MAG: arylamine N-acetyltransferase [Lachnospiraceae bacterium]|nr:arylamine N-acetyltransferase [Lachnospiraceae bacterium]
MYEFEFDGFTKEQCDAYLERIGAKFDGNPTKENLDYLLYQHHISVPFEDFAVFEHWGTVDLSAEALFDKIVVKRRGGFCFEMNGALLLLLKGLGYDVAGCMARIGNPVFGVLRRLDHRGILVFLDGETFYCDAGMGGPQPGWAVNLNGEKETRYGKTYWIDDAEKGWKELKHEFGDGGTNSVIFAPIAMLPFDFIANCADLVARGNSVFHENRMVNIRTVDGYVDLTNNTLKVNKNGETTIREITDEELPKVLLEYFGIDNYKK